MRWCALFLLVACGSPPPPVATATIAAPSVTASAPVPEAPPPFRGIEHPRFVAMDAGRIWLFGAGLSNLSTSQLPMGQTMRVHFATCEFDQTHEAERARCQSVTRAAFEKLDWNGIEPPLRWKLWQWASEHMTVVDAPLDPKIAQRYAIAHAAGERPPIGPELLVTSEKTTTLVDEMLSIKPAGAMPTSHPTGRKVPRVERGASAVFDGTWLPSSVIEDYYPLATSLVGSGARAVSARFLAISSEGERGGTLTDALRDAYAHELDRAKGLAILEATKQETMAPCGVRQPRSTPSSRKATQPHPRSRALLQCSFRRFTSSATTRR